MALGGVGCAGRSGSADRGRPSTAMSIAARGLRSSQARASGASTASASARSVFDDDDAVGEDRLLARLRRPSRAFAARSRRRPPRPRPRRRIRRRARGRSRTSAGSGRDRRGRWSRSAMRSNGGSAPRSRSITSRRSAICRSVRVMQQTQPLPSSVTSSAGVAHQRVVDADGAVFVDDDRGAAPSGVVEESAAPAWSCRRPGSR